VKLRLQTVDVAIVGILLAFSVYVSACASSPTPTVTPMPTQTLAPTATATLTSTPTPAPTATFTSTPAPTATFTSTPAPTATPTLVPSATATKPPTATPTASLRYPSLKLREPQDGRSIEAKSFNFEWESTPLQQDGDHYELFSKARRTQPGTSDSMPTPSSSCR
jgi:hypothetical protein